MGRTRRGRVPLGDRPRARRRAGGRDGDVGGEGVSLEVRRRALDHDAADGGARQHGGRLRAGHHQGRVLRDVRRRRAYGGRASAALYLSEAVPETVAGAGGYRGRVFRATGLPVPEGVDATEGIDEYGRFAPMLAVGKVPIGKVTPRLVAFRTAAEFVGDVWAPHSMEVVEELRADGDGWYTAYADCRVRVVFNDRTQLNLSKDRSMVRMLTPDVEKVEVQRDDPGEWSKHVIAALEFAGWAYLTPEEREAAAEAKIAMVDRIQAEIDRNRRMVSIISGKPGKDCYNDEELNELAVKAAKSGMATEFNTRVARLAAARAVLKRSVGFNGEPIEMPDWLNEPLRGRAGGCGAGAAR